MDLHPPTRDGEPEAEGENKGNPREEYRTQGGSLYLGSQERRGEPHNPEGVPYIWGARQRQGSPVTPGVCVIYI